jgi:tetratricopeptide (TPR) repeat protein
MPRRLVVAALILAVLAATAASGVELERRAPGEAPDSLLYLPNGKHLTLLSLGHAPLLADLIYLWAIQYYSDYERGDRYRWVEHVFHDVITELDPHYLDPYWLGALVLIVEAGDLEAGLRLLDKGAERNPQEWILPYLAAWECYRVRQYERAAAYFERSAAVPGAPPQVRRMVAAMTGRAGNIEESMALWQEIANSPASDQLSRAIAERQIRALQVENDLLRLDRAIERFRDDNGRAPASLDELVERSYVGGMPRDPEGRPYLYDAHSGTVTPAAGRILGAS